MSQLNFSKNLILSLLFLIPLISEAQSGWVQLNDAPFRTHHTYGFGQNGKGYVIQGNAGNPFWEYDQATDSWSRIGDFPGPSRGFAVGDDWEGKYYYGFGLGQNTNYNDLWVFDPTDMSWTELPSCPCTPRYHPAFIAHNDKIMMGTGFNNGNLDDWWEYDMLTQEWTQKQDVPGSPRHHPFFFSNENKVYVGGGHRNSWYEYDLDTEEFTAIDNTPGGRVAGTQFQYNGRGFLLGGDDANHDHVPPSETFMAFDPVTGEWEYLPEFPTGSRWASSSFLIDNIVYYFDGEDYDSPSANIEMWKFNLDELNCRPAENLNATAMEGGVAELFWNGNSKAVADTLKWRKEGETVWNAIPDAQPVATLDGLEDCTMYEYVIVSNCDSLSIASDIFTFRTKGCGACIDLDYCETQEFTGNLITLYIDEIGVNSYTNSSGDDDGYGNFASPDPEAIPIGGDFNFSMLSNSDVDGAVLKVWIDLNLDGEFSDDEKLLEEEMTEISYSGNLFVPGTAVEGLSRMRVSYIFSTGSSASFGPCHTPAGIVLGEVEDYCIQLSSSVNTDDFLRENAITVFPNPFKNTVQLKGDFSGFEKFDLKVLDLMGKVVEFKPDFSPHEELDLSGFANGVYFLQLEDENEFHKIKVVKQD